MWFNTAWGLFSFMVIQEGFEPPTHGLEVLYMPQSIINDKSWKTA